MKSLKYLCLPLILCSPLLAAPSQFAQERIDQAEARLQRDNARGALQVLEPLWDRKDPEDQAAGGRKILEILLDRREFDIGQKNQALKAVGRLLLIPGLSAEDEAEGRLARARVLFNNGKGSYRDIDASVVAYEQVLGSPRTPSGALVRAARNIAFPLIARAKSKGQRPMEVRNRRMELLELAQNHPNLSADDKPAILLEKASLYNFRADRKKMLEEAYALPGGSPEVRARVLHALAFAEEDYPRRRELMEKIVRGPSLGLARWNAFNDIGDKLVEQKNWDGLETWIALHIGRADLQNPERSTLLELRVQVLDARGEAAPARQLREQIARGPQFERNARIKALMHLGDEDAATKPAPARAWWKAALALDPFVTDREEAQDKSLASFNDTELGAARAWIEELEAHKLSSFDACGSRWARSSRRRAGEMKRCTLLRARFRACRTSQPRPTNPRTRSSACCRLCKARRSGLSRSRGCGRC